MPKFSMLVLMRPLAKNIQTHNLCGNGGVVVRNLFCYGQNPHLALIVPHVFERPLAGWIQISLTVPQSFFLCNHPVGMDTELHKPQRTPKTLSAWVISELQLMSTCLDLWTWPIGGAPPFFWTDIRYPPFQQPSGFPSPWFTLYLFLLPHSCWCSVAHEVYHVNPT